MAPHGAGLVEKSRVEGRLPAAGLAFGIDDLHPEPPQYTHHANANLGVDLVNITRHEKSYPHQPNSFPSNPPKSSGQYTNGSIYERDRLIIPVNSSDLTLKYRWYFNTIGMKKRLTRAEKRERTYEELILAA